MAHPLPPPSPRDENRTPPPPPSPEITSDLTASNRPVRSNATVFSLSGSDALLSTASRRRSKSGSASRDDLSVRRPRIELFDGEPAGPPADPEIKAKPKLPWYKSPENDKDGSPPGLYLAMFLVFLVFLAIPVIYGVLDYHLQLVNPLICAINGGQQQLNDTLTLLALKEVELKDLQAQIDVCTHQVAAIQKFVKTALYSFSSLAQVEPSIE